MESNETLVRCIFHDSSDNKSNQWIYCLLSNLSCLDKDQPNEKNSAILYNETDWVWLFHAPSDGLLEFKLSQCHPDDFQIERTESLEKFHQFHVPKMSSDLAVSLQLEWDSEYNYKIVSVDEIFNENEASFEKLPLSNENYNEESVTEIPDYSELYLKCEENVTSQAKISPKVKLKITTESLDSICGSSSEIEEILSHQSNKLGISAPSKNSSSDIPSSPEKKSSENISKVDEVPEDEVFTLMETEDGLVDIDRYLLENSGSTEIGNVETVRASSVTLPPIKSRPNVLLAKIHAIFGLGGFKPKNQKDNDRNTNNENESSLDNTSKEESSNKDGIDQNMEIKSEANESNSNNDNKNSLITDTILVDKPCDTGQNNFNGENKLLDELTKDDSVLISSITQLPKSEDGSNDDLLLGQMDVSKELNITSHINVDSTSEKKNSTIPLLKEESVKLKENSTRSDASGTKIEDIIGLECLKPDQVDPNNNTNLRNEDIHQQNSTDLRGNLMTQDNIPGNGFTNERLTIEIAEEVKDKHRERNIMENINNNNYSEQTLLQEVGFQGHKRSLSNEVRAISSEVDLESIKETDAEINFVQQRESDEIQNNSNKECTQVTNDDNRSTEEFPKQVTDYMSCNTLNVAQLTNTTDEFFSDFDEISEELCDEKCQINPNENENIIQSLEQQFIRNTRDNIIFPENITTSYQLEEIKETNLAPLFEDTHLRIGRENENQTKENRINEPIMTKRELTNKLDLSQSNSDLLKREISQENKNSCKYKNETSRETELNQHSNHKPLILISNTHLNCDYEAVNLIDSDFSHSTSSAEDLMLSHKIASKETAYNRRAKYNSVTENRNSNTNKCKRENQEGEISDINEGNLQLLDAAESSDSSLVTSLSKESLDELISTDNLYDKFAYIQTREEASNNACPNQVVGISIVTSQQIPLVQAANDRENNKLKDASRSGNSTLGCVKVEENADHIDRLGNHGCSEIKCPDSQPHNDRKTGENVCLINNDNNKRKDIHLATNVDVISISDSDNYFNTEILDCQADEEFPLAVKTINSPFHDNSLEEFSMLNPMLCFFLNKGANKLKHHERENEDLIYMQQRNCANKLSIETSISSNQDSAVVCDSDLTSDSQSAVGTIVQDDSFEEFMFSHPMTTSQTIDSLFISALSSNKKTISEENELPSLSVMNSHEVIFDDTNLPLERKDYIPKPMRPTEYCSLLIPPRSGMKRSPALDGVCDLLKKTDSELKLIQQQTYTLINDDDLYPDAVTPTKADSSLRLEGSNYDFPYIDDDAFWSDIFPSPRRFKYQRRAKLADFDECTLSSTKELSITSSPQKLPKLPIAPTTTVNTVTTVKKKRCRNRFLRLCRCGCFCRN